MTTTRNLLAAAIASASLLSAGAAFAQEATPDTWLHTTTSVQTRAAVIADAAAARQNGLAQFSTEGYITPLRSMTQRADVRSQTLQAIRSGEVKAINAEVYSQLPATTLQLSQAG